METVSYAAWASEFAWLFAAITKGTYRAKQAAVLAGLGHPDLASLRGANADDLYAHAQFHEGKALDKRVLYVFRCAVSYAEDPHPNPDEYRRWFFCDEGKGRKAGEK